MAEVKRKPAKECKLDEILVSQRVSVLCNIISLNKNALEGIISDGTKEAKVYFKNDEDLEKCKNVKLVRLIGKASVFEGLEINVEAVQFMDKVNLDLYKEILSLEND